MMRLSTLALCLTLIGTAAVAQDAPADPNAVPPPAAPSDPAPPTSSPSGAPAVTGPAPEAVVPDNPTDGAPETAAGTTTGEPPKGFDAGVLQSCLDASAEPGPRYACIGKAAMPCLEAPGNENTIGQSACLGAELDWWKAALNETYDRLYAAHEKTDAEVAGVAGATAQAPALEAAQKAWLAYRDAECGYQSAFFAGGSGSGPAAVGCEMDLTGRRAIDMMASLAAAESR